MAACRCTGDRSAGGSNASRTCSARAWRACVQRSKSVLLRTAREVLKQPGLENLDLLLRILEGRLAELQQLRPALVGPERLLERQLARFHAGDDAFQLRQRGFERQRAALDRSRASLDRD